MSVKLKQQKQRKHVVPQRAIPVEPAPLPDRHAVTAAVAGLIAAWIASGAVGLFGHPLRHALTWLALAVVVAAEWPRQWRSWRQMLAIAAAIVAALIFTASELAPLNIIAVAVPLGIFASLRSGRARTMLSAAAISVAVLVLYRFAHQSIPIVWYISDGIAHAFGVVAGFIARKKLNVGVTFGGMDYLVTAGTLYALLLLITPGPKKTRAITWAAIVLGAHLFYLMALAHLAALASAWPAHDTAEPLTGLQAHWSFAESVKKSIPWNVPALAALLHGVIAAFMLRRLPDATAFTPSALLPARFAPYQRQLRWAALALAIALPVVATLSLGRCEIKGRKIIFFEKGFLNWLKPEHGEYGRLSIGMYGMMQQYIRSLGGQCLISPELSAQDLHNADAVVMMFPNEAWAPGQLERVHDFVREGGTLLVMGEHSTKEEDVPWEVGGNRYNEILRPTAIQVAFDSAQFAVGGWLQSYQAMAHPATAGVGDQRNEFGVVIGASLDIHFPASPILVGRFGWNDPGDVKSERAMMGNDVYDPGERLGDQVLAAEQPFGKGRIIAFGDTSSLTNGITVGTHIFTSRLLAYIANGAGSPQALWRQIPALLMVIALLVLLLRWPGALSVTIVITALGICTFLCAAVNERLARTLPDGRGDRPNSLAYIDTSHLSAASEESWRPDGTMGMVMTLMRDGYVTLTLPEFDEDRIMRAGLVISVAPLREFSREERRIVRRYVESGGVFICTAGFEHRAGSQSLLADFGFRVGDENSPFRDPQPMGHFKSPYINFGDRMAYVRFHAGWPISCTDPSAQPIVYGPGNKDLILMRRIGQGKFVLIGDSAFAMNVNLEHESGQAFEGMRENPDFWRWFIDVLTDQPQPWLPSPPPPTTTPATAPADGEAAE